MFGCICAGEGGSIKRKSKKRPALGWSTHIMAHLFQIILHDSYFSLYFVLLLEFSSITNLLALVMILFKMQTPLEGIRKIASHLLV